jgi:hypothetical protein
MPADGQDGYATPAAAVISFAIAVVVAAVTTRAAGELRLAKAEVASLQTDYALAGAQNAAMAVIATSSRPPPYHWTVPSLGQAVDVLAEPERDKLSLAAAAGLDDEALVWLGSRQPAATRDRLVAVQEAKRLVWIAEQSEDRRWEQCAASYVSPYGVGAQLSALSYGEPEPAQQPGRWRAGEVWRIQVTLPSGWRDERIVRFTGDGVRPAIVLGRRLIRVMKGQQTCEAQFEPASGA